MPPDEIADDGLVIRVRAGDADALGEFLVARRPQLMAFLERRLGAGLRRKIEPDDLFQDVSAEAVRSLGDVDLNERDPFNWLCQVAERRIIDAHRRFFGSQKRDAGREVSLNAGGVDTSRGGLINLLVASMTTASQAFSRDQRQMRLLSALDQLPEEHREALKLRYLEGLPSKQIAEKLNKTDGAIRVMLTRSLAKLQQILEAT
ncbi:MAG: sigma-70 family RNA polymerase sigma factor [Pirellulales bacterium]|nr:sigma-70 family RNA polymerase sigma factor [Pirellulales bacterium]